MKEEMEVVGVYGANGRHVNLPRSMKGMTFQLQAGTSLQLAGGDWITAKEGDCLVAVDMSNPWDERDHSFWGWTFNHQAENRWR